MGCELTFVLDYRPSDFLDELAANATQHGIAIVMYNGNDDLSNGHGDTERMSTLLG